MGWGGIGGFFGRWFSLRQASLAPRAGDRQVFGGHHRLILGEYCSPEHSDPGTAGGFATARALAVSGNGICGHSLRWGSSEGSAQAHRFPALCAENDRGLLRRFGRCASRQGVEQGADAGEFLFCCRALPSLRAHAPEALGQDVLKEPGDEDKHRRDGCLICRSRQEIKTLQQTKGSSLWRQSGKICVITTRKLRFPKRKLVY